MDNHECTQGYRYFLSLDSGGTQHTRSHRVDECTRAFGGQQQLLPLKLEVLRPSHFIHWQWVANQWGWANGAIHICISAIARFKLESDFRANIL